jgi:hypothetical protein
MQVQTFLLARKVTMSGHDFDIAGAGVSSFDANSECVFPTRFTFPAFIMLGRESDVGDVPFTLRLNLVDEDGRNAGQPRQMLVKGMFPNGVSQAKLMAKIDFEFPKIGKYRLDLTADEGLTGEVYHYDIRILERPHPSQ